MTVNIDQIKQWVVSVVHHSITDSDLTRLINTCIAIAKSHLTTFHWKQLIHFSYAGYTPQLAACRCIEELFFHRNSIKCFELRQYFINRSENISAIPEEEIYIALNQLIKSKIAQRLAEIYGELDPEYKKILRNVQEAVSRNNIYSIQDHVKGIYVSLSSEKNLLHNKPAFPLDELQTELSLFAGIKDSTPVLVKKIFLILSKQETYRRLLTIDDLVTLIRDYHEMFQENSSPEGMDTQDQTDDEAIHAEVSFHRDKLLAIINRSILHLNKTIIAKHIKRGTLTKENGEKISSAVKKYLEDIISQTSKTHFDYYHVQFPDVSYEKFRKRKRKQFEYIVACTREDFRIRCEKYFKS